MITEAPRLIETNEGHTILYQGKYLYSPDKPRSSVKRRVKKTDIPPRTLLFVPSPLLFYGFDVLLKRLPKDCHILCMEADQELMALSVTHTDAKWYSNQQVTYIRANTPDKIQITLGKIGLWRFRRALMLRLSRGYAINGELYSSLYSLIESEIQRFWRNKMTTIHLAELWFRNIFNNVPHINHNSSFQNRLLNFSSEKPPNDNKPSIERAVVVVGAGESLEGTLPLLSKIRDDVFILCVDTALPVLEASSIRPDAVCIVESQFINIKDFVPCPSRDIPVFCDMTSNSTVLNHLPGPKYFFLSQAVEASLIERIADGPPVVSSIPALGSVGIVAVYLAMHLTDRPIFLTGLDFSYALGKPHARGSLSHTEILLRTDRFHPPHLLEHSYHRKLIKVQDKHGALVWTDNVLHSYAQELHEIVKERDNVYDLSGKGLDTGAILLEGPPFGASPPTEKQVKRLIENSMPMMNDTSGGSLPGGADSTTDPESLLTLFARESAYLDRAISLGKTYIQGKSDEKTERSLRKALKDIDYVYCHFPDSTPLDELSTHFVKRVLVSASKYRDLITRNKERLIQERAQEFSV